MSGKMLGDQPEAKKDIGNAYRQRLNSIKAVLVPQDINEALSPKVLEQVNAWVVAGKHSGEIIRLLGLSYDDPRWKAIRKEILKQTIPEGETEALLRSYQEQEELFERMEGLLKEIEAKIEEKPRSDEEIKAQHHFYKYKLDLLKEMLAHRSDKFRQYMEVKKLNKGPSGTNVQIIIQNNIPRPMTVDRVAKELEDDD